MQMQWNMTLENLPEVASSIIPLLEQWCPVAAFYGELGTGKTTLIAEICHQLEVTDTVSSPSFSIVNEYHTRSGKIIYHFDFYRIKDISEAYDLGYEEYFYSGNLCFIEWPGRISDILPDSYIRIVLRHLGETTRLVTAEFLRPGQ